MNEKKEKERKRNQSKKYGKAAYLQSRRGVISCWLTGWSLAILLGCVRNAYPTHPSKIASDRMVTCYLAGMCRICIPDERKGSRNCRRDCNPFFND